MTAEEMAALTDKVLARYQEELIEADDQQLLDLARRAEGRYASELGAQMRALVNAERDRRVRRDVELSPLTIQRRTWVA